MTIVVKIKEGKETTVKQNFCNETKLVLIQTTLFQVKMLNIITRATIKKVPQNIVKEAVRKLKWYTIKKKNNYQIQMVKKTKRWRHKRHKTESKQQNGRCNSYLINNCIIYKWDKHPIKSQKLAEWINIHDPIIQCLQEKYCLFKDKNRLKKICPANSNQRELEWIH